MTPARLAVLFCAPALWAAPTTASASGLTCTFTQICAPQVGCRSSDGVPFDFALISGALSYAGPNGPVFGTPLPHVTPPNSANLFELSDSGTALLTLSDTGEAAWTEQGIAPGGQNQAVSYYGTCAPAT